MAQGTTRGVPIDIDPLLTADSDLLVPSQKAAKSYIDNGLSNKQNALGFTPENVANKENTTLDTSTTKYPTNRLTKEYADAKVADSITNGVTTIAPSQNAVFDALALKQNALGYTPYRYVNATRATYLASVIGVAEYTVAQTTILGSTFSTTDVMKMITRFSKPSGVGSVTLRVKINTTNTLVGATQIALLNLAAANTTSLLTRTFNLSGGNLYGYNFASSLALDLIATNTVGSSTAYTTTSDLYVFFTVQIANPADSITFELANITN